MERYETCPHFLALLRTVTHGQAGFLTSHRMLRSGVMHSSRYSAVSLAISGTGDIGSLPTGRACNEEHGVYLTWMVGRLYHWKCTAPPHNCYIQSGPHLAAAFLMWMHCSVWVNLSCSREAFRVLLSRDSNTDIKALLRQALYEMFCQMVPFPSSSHFLVLLQPLEKANPFIRLHVNWWLSRPATKNIQLDDFSGKMQQEETEVSFLRILILLSLYWQSEYGEPCTAVNKKENSTVSFILPS